MPLSLLEAVQVAIDELLDKHNISVETKDLTSVEKFNNEYELLFHSKGIPENSEFSSRCLVDVLSGSTRIEIQKNDS